MTLTFWTQFPELRPGFQKVLDAFHADFPSITVNQVPKPAQQYQQIFNTALPQPPIHADLNGLFLLAVAVGYVIPYRDPDGASGRTYLWVMGPLLKGLGAAAFIADYLVRHSPASFLLFAVSDGAMAVLTLWALTTSPRMKPSSYASGVRT